MGVGRTERLNQMTTIYKDFEDFLKSKHAEEYTGTDDDITDDFDSWISIFSSEDWIVYANEYAKVYAGQEANAVIPF